MEATEALSVAAAAVGFADFLIKVVKQISETRASIKGQPDRVVDLATCMAELSSIASTVQNGIKGLSSSYPQHADSIDHLTKECFDIETRVKVVADKLTVDRAGRLETALSTALVAFHSVWLEKELAELSDRLNGIRSRIQLYVLTYTLDEVKNTHNQTDEIREIVQRIEVATDGRECDFERNGAGQVSDPSGQTRVTEAEAIWALTGLVDFSTDLELPPLPTPPATNMDIRKIKKSPFAQNICYNLYTAEMGNRESLVALAFPKTFQWLFNIPPGDQPGRGKDSGLRFRQWLGSPSETVFWITGVPASGKSTLMKFITTYPSLKDQLRGWAGDDQLYIAKFYFWGPGSETQKSRVGLLRSLLHQLLTARPDLAEAVAPRRHLFFQLAGDGSMYPEWEWSELTQCMLRFVTLIRKTGSRLALFIDGLDEYDGFLEENPATHKTTDEMMDFLISLSRDPGVKICVSSRPLNIFMDKFKLSPSLAMQDVTQPDINLYVDEQLGKSEAIKDLRRWGSKEMESVTRELKQKANGVFLWVVLMVEQLLLTSQDNPSIDAIRKVMRDSPKDLNTLYDRIQDKIGPRKGSDASRLYQLIMTWKRFWKGPMKATFLWLAFDGDIRQQEYPGPDRGPDIAKFTKRLLAGHTQGLLQVSDSSSPGNAHRNTHTVDFLHRTAYEWIQERSNWGRILDSGPADYEPVLPILAVLVSRTLYLGDVPDVRSLYCRLCQIFLLAGNVTDTPDARAKLVPIIDRLDPYLRPDRYGLFRLFQPGDPAAGRGVQSDAVTWAAVFACHPYLQGKFEAGTGAGATARPEQPAWWAGFLRAEAKPRAALIEMAMSGRIFGTSRLLFILTMQPHSIWHGYIFTRARLRGGNNWSDVEGHVECPWNFGRRLRTVKVLLENGCKINSSAAYWLEHGISESMNSLTRYNHALAKIARRSNPLKDFDSIASQVIKDELERNLGIKRYWDDEADWPRPNDDRPLRL